jgi:peptidoglycan hydrolase-like protein with peptidoglycan-binding domain
MSRRRTGRIVLTVGVAAAVAAAAAAATGFADLSGGGGGGTAAAAVPPATAKVTRQTLVDRQSKDGGLGYGDAVTLTARAGGTVTALAAGGSTVTRGKVLYRLDDQPVVLVYGSLPAYRPLAPGTEGPDVRQLEKNLYALGYRGFTVDDTYTSSTADAVAAWQGDLGLPETGTVELGRVVFAAGPVRVDSREAAVGDALQLGGSVLSYTGTTRLVTVSLDVSDQRLARKGAAVVLTLPDGSTTPGKIAAVKTVVDTDSSNPGSDEPVTKIEVTITADQARALSGLDEASIAVAFTASSRADVLTVPVAALLALAEGGYGVQVVDGDTTRILAVKTGLFADGRVEVSGDGLRDGMTVGMPS